MRIFRAALLALAVSSTSALANGQITVVGTGTVAAVPDMATLTLTISREAREADAAVREMSEAAQRVLGDLVAAEIEPADMQSSSLRLAPMRDFQGDGSGRPPRIVGYLAETDIRVEIHDFARIGVILDSAVVDGANGLNGLVFGVADRTALEDAARERAVADGQRKAGLYAAAAGVTLGPLLALTESGASAPPVLAGARMAEMASGLAPGELSVSVSATMVFAIGE